MARHGSAAGRGPVSIVGALIALLASLAALALLLSRPAPVSLPGWFARLPAGDRSRFFSPAAPLRKLRLAAETRNALLARAGMPVRQPLAPSAGRRMQVAFSVLCPPEKHCAGGVSFDVAALTRAGRMPLLQARIPFDGSPGWQTRLIDLKRFRNDALTVELSVVPYGPRAQGTRLPVGVWGEPLIVGGASRQAPNVLLISLDTLRADHLGSYGYARQTSPTLDRFAAAGVRFAQAMSQAPWTTPSHMSLFTSLYPTTHRVNQTWSYLSTALRGRGRARPLASAVTTLPEILRANGYRTLALTGGATMTAALGFARGFDVYREDAAKLTRDVGATFTNWLNTFATDPFFLFLHTFEVHAPYTHLTFAAPLLSDAQRAEFSRLVAPRAPDDWFNLNSEVIAYLQAQELYRREVTEALYDGGILAADGFIDNLFTALRQRGLYDNTLIILFSDHGEEFGEHQPERIYGSHGASMHDPMIHVPLLLGMPGRFPPGTVVADQVELIDVAPTILDLVGVAAPAAMQGRSLAALIDGTPGDRKDWAMSEAASQGDELKALRTPEFKYIMVGEVRDDERSGMPAAIKHELLFDLRSDPQEQQPIEQPERMTAMRTQLETLLRAMPADGTHVEDAVIDADVHERLRALGYAR